MSGNASYDRSPRGFLKTLRDDVDRLKHRIPPQVIAASGGGMVAPTVNTHTQIITRSTPPNATSNSWWGTGARIEYITMTAEAGGVLNQDTMWAIRGYPYAIYNMGVENSGYGWGHNDEYFYGFEGLTVYIYKGTLVDQDYPGLGDPGGDNDSDNVWMDLTFASGDDAFVVEAGQPLTIALVWWNSWKDVAGGRTVYADVGGLVYAINAALGGVNLDGQSWRSTAYPDDFLPSFELTASGYYKTDPLALGQKGYGADSEGLGNFAKGAGSHAEGMATQAFGQGAHSEGWGTIASGQSHSEGRFTRALAQWSHSEGEETFATANARGAHVEGYQSKADGMYSHAEQSGRVESGAILAHAEGSYTKAWVSYSHVEGAGTESHRYHEHADGGKWGSTHLISVSRVSGPGYATNVTTSGHMLIPRIFVGPQEVLLTRGRLTRIEVMVLGIAANETVGACWRVLGLAYFPNSGSARVIGTPTVTKEFGDAGTASWTVSIAVTTAGQIRVTTNPAGTSSRWSGLYHLTEVPYDDLHM